jgi:hypothetical protein
MSSVITSTDQVTPGWLTRILHQAGILPCGEVTTVASAPKAALSSVTTHFHLTYSDDAPPSAPRRLLLKRNRAEEWAQRAGAREAAFYGLVARLPDRLPMLVPCYDAAYDAQSGNSHILLDDLSASHKPPITRDQQFLPAESVPPAVYMEQVVDALAAFHAYWWEHPLLGSTGAGAGTWYADQEHFERHLQRRRDEWARFIAAEGGWLPATVRALCEQVLAQWPRLWERYLGERLPRRKNLTLTHGDAYFCNFLSPRDPTKGATYVVDWQSPEIAPGPADLVNLYATFWTPAQRHEDQREERLLRRYHSRLQERGVAHYSWEDLLLDYKLMVHEWVFVAIWDQTNGSDTSYWWPKLQCLTGAYQDLGCGRLLDG